MTDGAAAVLGAILVSHLLGTFPTAQLVGRRLGFDPTTAGSGNPGASNTTRLGGKRAGAVVLAGDAAKGALAAGLGYALDGRTLAWFAGAAAVAGHMWPVTRRLRGGKGVATVAGVAAVCAPLGLVVLAGVFAVVLLVWGKAALGSLAVAALLPVVVAVSGHDAVEVAVAAAIALAIVVRHHGNIRRLLAGTETGMRS
jgi:glycerol-3-phosphate acyltransferase PlsY